MTGTHTYRFTIRTDAYNTRNRRGRTRTWVVDAAHAEDAIVEANRQAVNVLGWNTSIAATIVDVDSNGAPKDCEHGFAGRIEHGYVMRPDGGRDCKPCADAHGITWPTTTRVAS